MRNYRAISDIAHLLHGRRTYWRALALLEAFFDESGTHGRMSRTVAIAGYVATEEEWTKVQKRWQEVLQCHGIKVFHATDFFAQCGEFTPEKLPDRDGFLSGLVDAIQQGELHTITAATDAGAYERATIPAFRNVFPKPYDLCFNEIIRGVDFWSSQKANGETVGLVFASSEEYDNRSLATFANWKSYRHIPTIGALAFDWPHRVPALQCADLLANRLYRQWDSLLMDQHGGGKLLIDPLIVTQSGAVPQQRTVVRS